jgi:thiamine pyrophosphate-dependent acetolactate synthase large subunit-like protein
LLARGVDNVFALMSGDVAPAIVALAEEGVRVVSARHVAGAIGMADGYYRASGRVGIAIVGHGPGLTNGINALVTAARAGSGVVVLTGAPSLGSARTGGPKAVDQVGLLAALGVRCAIARSASTLARDLESHIAAADGGRTVVFSIPVDVMDAAVAPTRPVESTTRNGAPQALHGDVVGLLLDRSRARRPLLIAGRGAVQTDTLPAIESVADRLGAALGTTLCARSAFAGNQSSLGTLGAFAPRSAMDLAAAADVAVGFGTSFDPLLTEMGELLQGKTLIHFDRDPIGIADLEVRGDLRLTVPMLDAELARREVRFEPWVEPGLADERTSVCHLSARAAAPTQPLEAQDVLSSIDRLLPEERTIVIDGGNNIIASIPTLAVSEPRGFLFTCEYHAIGCGQAVAIGAAVARPDRLTVLVMGDGGAMMTLGEFDTAVRERLRLLVIVLNDSGFGAERNLLEDLGLPTHLAGYRNPSFASLAESFGATGLTVEKLDDLSRLEANLQDLEGPCLVDCVVRTGRASTSDLLARMALRHRG